MPKARILLLEDDANLGLIVQEHLQFHDFDVRLCADGLIGMEAYMEADFDLCLVDVMMPNKDGFSFAREVRARDLKIPIIFLTAKSLKEDKIEGFKIGGDDYITKPFSVEELLLRIKAVLKRSMGTGLSGSDIAEAQTEFDIGSYSFDYHRQILSRKKSSRRLTPRENELLHLLCLNLNQTLMRDTALKRIWGDDNYFTGRSMDVFISKLRKYLKDDPAVEIMSVHGQGFRLIVN